MSQPYVGQIMIFGGNFAPLGWAFCNGALLPIAENETLYTLIGTTYGGDGQNTFALPDLQGRVPLHMGQGPNITQKALTPAKAGAAQAALGNLVSSRRTGTLRQRSATRPTPPQVPNAMIQRESGV